MNSNIDDILVEWTNDGVPEISVPFDYDTDDLQVKVLEAGSGDKITPDDRIRVHYLGVLKGSEQFDSSYDRGESITFPLKGVIPGWTIGISGQKVGAKLLLAIPPDLAYGDNEVGSIPANSVLIFIVEILEKM